MQRIIADILNGPGRLILSESFLCDDRDKALISLPTASAQSASLVFEFFQGEVLKPTFQVREESSVTTIQVWLGNRNGNFLATKHRVNVWIGGKPYFWLFNVTRLIEHSVRVEFSLYESGGLL